MGCFLIDLFTPNNETDGQITNNQIDQQINEDAKTFRKTIKILLLGTTEAGKSTVFKQMKLLHCGGFTDVDRAEKVPLIRYNVHHSIYTLVTMVKKFDLRFESEASVQSAEYILQLGPEMPETFTTYEYVSRVQSLWFDVGIQKCYRRANEFNLVDCAKYFLEKIAEIADENYVPSDEDILNSRYETIGIEEITFIVTQSAKRFQIYHLVDVGGQQSEIQKWMLCFSGVNAVLFITSCGQFDECAKNNSSLNRLQESINIFKVVWRNRFLRDTSMIVFLNKQDILERKIIGGKKIESFFPDYAKFKWNKPQLKKKSSNDKNVCQVHPEVEQARNFIQNMFAEATKNPKPTYNSISESESDAVRQCFFHFTVATNTENIQVVFKACQQIIMANILKHGSV